MSDSDESLQPEREATVVGHRCDALCGVGPQALELWLRELFEDPAQAVRPLPGPPLVGVGELHVVLFGPHDNVVEPRTAQQRVEVVGSVEGPLHRPSLDDHIGEELVLPCPARVVRAPRRHTERATGDECAMEPCQGALGVGKEEDPEAAQHRRERRVPNTRCSTSITRSSAATPAVSTRSRARRTISGDRSTPRTRPVGPTRAAAGTSTAPLPHATSRTASPGRTPASSTSRSPKWSWYAPATLSWVGAARSNTPASHAFVSTRVTRCPSSRTSTSAPRRRCRSNWRRAE